MNSNRISLIGIFEARVQYNNLNKVLSYNCNDWSVETTKALASNIRIMVLQKVDELLVLAEKEGCSVCSL